MPGVLMFPARQTMCGPSTTGSTSWVSVRFGSAAVTTARACSVSPPARRTPTARPSSFVRIS